MMRQERQYPYYRGENFQAISLAYGDGRMRMYISSRTVNPISTAF